MDFRTSAEMAEEWGITRRRVSKLCQDGRVEGAMLRGHTWLIPDTAKKPQELKSGPKKKEAAE